MKRRKNKAAAATGLTAVILVIILLFFAVYYYNRALSVREEGRDLFVGRKKESRNIKRRAGQHTLSYAGIRWSR